jgi:hypothetical protein
MIPLKRDFVSAIWRILSLHDMHDLHDLNHPAEAGQKP